MIWLAHAGSFAGGECRLHASLKGLGMGRNGSYFWQMGWVGSCNPKRVDGSTQPMGQKSEPTGQITTKHIKKVRKVFNKTSFSKNCENIKP